MPVNSKRKSKRGELGVVFVGLVEFPGYLLGTDGSVWSYWSRGVRPVQLCQTARRLVPAVSSSGYHLHALRLKGGGRRKTIYPHRMVLTIFVGACPPGCEACHNNGEKADNSLSNLRWDTRKGNHADKWLHGTAQVGLKHGCCKFAVDVPREARRLRRLGLPYSKIAKRLGCSRSYAFAVCKGILRRYG